LNSYDFSNSKSLTESFSKKLISKKLQNVRFSDFRSLLLDLKNRGMSPIMTKALWRKLLDWFCHNSTAPNYLRLALCQGIFGTISGIKYSKNLTKLSSRNDSYCIID
jgi:hypothetical protein